MQKIDAAKNLFKRLAKQALAPPPDLTVSEWADKHRRLSRESSAEAGQWRTDRAPYQREIMNVINDAFVEDIVIMASAQVGKSEILLNALGYFIDFDPSPILLIQPTEQKAKDFSKERIAPMIRDTPVLKERIGDAKTRDSSNTVMFKSFPGGFIALGGANAPSGLAARPIRILLADEIDRYPVSAGTEGDPLDLAEKRTNNFYNRKKLKVSTPTIKGVSRIEKEFELSTKEYYNLPCPRCGEYQPLTWGQIDFETESHRCKFCGYLSSEFEWKTQEGKWIATAESSIRGFHLNELLSPWRRWGEVITSFLRAKKKGTEALKVWTNTSLGEPWEEEGQKIDDDSLFGRREDYEADVPDGVKILTAAVDVQDDRFEIEVVGWGIGRESWGIEYHIIHGDLKQERIWNELDDYLKKTWAKKDGKQFAIACTCIDSGGHFTQEVYRFTKDKLARMVYAIKGASAQKGEYVPLIAGTTKTKVLKTLLVSLGVNDGKSRVMSSLNVEDFGPNYCHFPVGRGYEKIYFKSLTAEKLETRYEKGIPYQQWVKIRARNEAFDLRVYNTAAIEILNPNFDKEYTMTTKPKKKRKRRGVR
ncbi:phage terminase large subunit family protein [Schinkia azotoformans]|uniref:phage terminase large subunit family protein n=1 Tax=Schinkia azotoformans TaxID=1454 RepID=UPI002DB80895|nr:phage terminase large subunit family protein [Schinkia azotoformans]MEC1744131.1 phage terminase large subunit family protein [Schinkia azotoformans]